MGEDQSENNPRARLYETYAALAQALSSNADVSVKLLPEKQFLVTSHLIPNPAFGSTFKTAQFVPAPNGFTILVRLTPADEKDRPQQRTIHPAEFVSLNPATMKLTLDRDSLDQSWLVLSPEGEHISIAVHCGSEEVFDEVDRVLVLVGRFLIA